MPVDWPAWSSALDRIQPGEGGVDVAQGHAALKLAGRTARRASIVMIDPNKEYGL